MGSNYNTTSSRNYITEENIPRIDPTFPTTIGGLLAEEWTINPNSALPSFLEMTMIDEARKSGCQTIQWILQQIEHKLFQMASSSSSSSSSSSEEEEEETVDNNNNNNNNRSSRSSWLMRYRSKFFMFIVNNILKPYKPEIRFVIMYYLERKSLLSTSSSATISESLYGGKRCKLIEEVPVVVPPPQGGGGEMNNNNNNNSKQKQQKQQKQQHGQYRLSSMSKQDGIRLAFLLALGPYLQERCSIIYENLTTTTTTTNPNNGRISSSSLKIKKIIKVVFPFLHMTIQGIHLLYRWKFLMGKSFYFDGYSRYLNLIVRRITMADQQQHQQQQQQQQSKKTGKTVASSNLSSSSSSSSSETAAVKMSDQDDDDTTVYNMYADTMKNILKSKKLRQIAIGILSSTAVLGWIARIRASRYEIINNRRRERLLLQQQQQHQQQQQSNDNNNNIDDSFPPYPPPPIPTNAREGVDRSLANVSPKLCPLCRRPRVNPTAATSGYVFCLKCLLAYISKNPICPVTGKACPENSIVQLFEPNL